MISAKMFIRYCIFPLVYFGGFLAVTQLVSSGANTWIAMPLLVCAFGITIAACELFVPYIKEWKPDRQEFKIDATHYVVNYGVKQIAVLLMGFALSFLSFSSMIWPAEAPFAIQVILAAVIFDFVLYWIHRISHRENLFWRLHTVHHSPDKLYVLNGEKRHPLHQIAEGVPALILLIVLGVPSLVIVAFLSFLNLNMMLQHANIDYRMGPLKYLFAGAETHRYHHFRDIEQKVGMVNFAQIFVPFDLLFGTFHYDKPGVGKDQAGIAYLPTFPGRYVDHMRWPFSRSLRARHLRYSSKTSQ